jgi:hypothetical protein
MVLNHIRRNLQLMTPAKINLSERTPLAWFHSAGDRLQLWLQFHQIEVELLLVHVPGLGRGLRNRFLIHALPIVGNGVGLLRGYPSA